MVSKITTMIVLTLLLIPISLHCSDSDDEDYTKYNTMPTPPVKSTIEFVTDALQDPLVQSAVQATIHATKQGLYATGQILVWAAQKGLESARSNKEEHNKYAYRAKDDDDEYHSDTSSIADDINDNDYEDIGANNTIFTNQKILQKHLQEKPDSVQKQLNESLKQYFHTKNIQKTSTQHNIQHLLSLIEASKTQKNPCSLTAEIANLYTLPALHELQKCIQSQHSKHESIETEYDTMIKKSTEKCNLSIQKALETYKKEKQAADEKRFKKILTNYTKAHVRAHNTISMNNYASRKIDCTMAEGIIACKNQNEYETLIITENQEIQTIISSYQQRLQHTEKIITAIVNVDENTPALSDHKKVKGKR